MIFLPNCRFEQGGIVTILVINYIAFEAVTVFANITAHEFSIDAVHGCILDTIDLFAAGSHAIIVVIVCFEELVCSKGAHFVPLELLKKMFQIDTANKLTAFTGRTS